MPNDLRGPCKMIVWKKLKGLLEPVAWAFWSLIALLVGDNKKGEHEKE
jgi:hypothetical protein